MYALQGSPMHESPLNLIPASLRAEFRDTYGVEIRGELSPWARDRLEREFEGDFLRMPVERVFLSEASRVGVGTYAPHDPTTRILPISSARWTCRRSRSTAMKAIRVRGHGRAPCTPQAAACSR